jgi:hypothetical protein
MARAPPPARDARLPATTSSLTRICAAGNPTEATARFQDAPFGTCLPPASPLLLAGSARDEATPIARSTLEPAFGLELVDDRHDGPLRQSHRPSDGTENESFLPESTHVPPTSFRVPSGRLPTLLVSFRRVEPKDDFGSG